MALIGDNHISQFRKRVLAGCVTDKAKQSFDLGPMKKIALLKKSQFIALRFPIFINAIGLYGQTIQTRFALLRKVQKSK